MGEGSPQSSVLSPQEEWEFRGGRSNNYSVFSLPKILNFWALLNKCMILQDSGFSPQEVGTFRCATCLRSIRERKTHFCYATSLQSQELGVRKGGGPRGVPEFLERLK